MDAPNNGLMHNGFGGKLIKVTTLPKTENSHWITSWTNTIILTMNLCFWQLYFKLFEMLLPARRKWSMQHFTLTAEVELGLFVLNIQFCLKQTQAHRSSEHIKIENFTRRHMGCCCCYLPFIFKTIWTSCTFESRCIFSSSEVHSLHGAANIEPVCALRRQNWRTKLKRALQKIRHWRILLSWI